MNSGGSASSSSGRARLGIGVLVLLLAFALRLWQLDTQSLWHDEGWSVFAAYTPFAPMGIRGADVNAPWAYYASVGAWLRLVGDSVWSMRSWSAILGLITVAASMWVARAFCGGQVALLTGLFVAVNPILWTFSQEIRAYVVMPLGAMLLLGLAARWLARPWPVAGAGSAVSALRLKTLLMLAVVQFFTLYAQNLAVPLVAWLNVTVIAVLLAWREWRRLFVWLAAQAALFVLYLPWLLTQRPTGTALNTPPAITPELLWNIWHSHFTGVKALINADALLVGLIATFGVIGAVGVLAALWRRRDLCVGLALSQVILVPAFEVAIIYAAHIDFHPRYFIVSVPAALMLIAWGAFPASRPGRPAAPLPLESGLSGVRVFALSGLALGIMARVGMLTFSSPTYQHDDFRSIAERYARLTERDAIVIPYGWEPSLDYYREKLNFRARVVEVPFQSSAATITESLLALGAAERIEVLTWYQLPADVRGAFPCVLDVISRQTEDTLTTSGVRSDHYARDPAHAPDRDLLAPPSIPGRALAFGALSLVHEGDRAPLILWGNTGLCVRTFWQLRDATDRNLRLVLRLYNDLGWLVGQVDSLMLDDRQLPTSLWLSGDASASSSMFSMFSRIPMPEAAPNGPYTLTISLYDQRDPQGVEASDARSGVSLGKMPTLFIVPLVRDTLPAPVGTLTDQDAPLIDGLYLQRRALPERLSQGQRARLTLEWWQTRALADVRGEVTLRGESWQARAERGNCIALLADSAGKQINWCELTVPPTASGKAVLTISVGGRPFTVAEYALGEIGRQFSEPAFLYTARLDPPAAFVGVGHLLGAAMGARIAAGTPFEVSLLWRATDTPTSGYTIFVHLVTPDGRVVAQSDAEPVGGTRPTYGWVPGEYVIDLHTLRFNASTYRGAAQIVIGLYEAATGERVGVINGADRAILPQNVRVEVE